MRIVLMNIYDVNSILQSDVYESLNRKLFQHSFAYECGAVIAVRSSDLPYGLRTQINVFLREKKKMFRDD